MTAALVAYNGRRLAVCAGIFILSARAAADDWFSDEDN